MVCIDSVIALFTTEMFEDYIRQNNYAYLVGNIDRLIRWIDEDDNNLRLFVTQCYSLSIFDRVLKHVGEAKLTKQIKGISGCLTGSQLWYLTHNVGLKL